MPVNLAQLREKYREVKQKLNRDSKTWRPDEGNNWIRIIEPPKGFDSFFYEIRLIFGLQKFPIVSPSTFGEPCPVVEAVAELWDSPQPEDQQLAKDLNPSTKFLIPIVTKKEPDKLQIFECPITVMEQIMALMVPDDEDEEDESYGDITSTKKGRFINVKRTGTGLDTRYQVIPASSAKVLKGAKALQKEYPDLEKIARERSRSYDEMKAMLEGEVLAGGAADDLTDDIDDEWEDEDIEEEDDEEWEEEWEEEDEDDEDEEDDEEEDEEDEEDEDEEDWEEEDDEEWDDEDVDLDDEDEEDWEDDEDE